MLLNLPPSDEVVNTCEYGPITNNVQIEAISSGTELGERMIANSIYMTEVMLGYIESGKLKGIHDTEDPHDWMRLSTSNLA